MKKFFAFLVPVFLLASCGGGSSGDDVFYETSSKILPNINTELIKGASLKINEASTNVCNESPIGDVKTVCDTFEAYTSDNWNNEEATLGHQVSMTNFYKFIIQTDAYISDGLRQTCETLSGKVKLLYDDEALFWQSQDNYTCKASYTESSDRFKAYAWDQNNNKYAVMYDHQDGDDEALTYGSKATSSFDLTVKLFGKGSRIYRKFTGNATDQTFTMQDLNNSGYKLALAGYAQGVGNHFLAKSDSGTEKKSYCFTIDSQEEYTASSGATITVITGLSVGAEDDVTDCADLVTTVDDLLSELDSVTVPAKHFEHEFKAL